MLGMKKYLQFKFIELIPEKGPWAALLLIPVTIISGAYWNSIPFYLVIATLWLFQSKSPIPWETGITLMGTTLLAVFIVSKTDYTFWIYSIKIIGCFVIIETDNQESPTYVARYVFCFLFVVRLGE